MKIKRGAFGACGADVVHMLSIDSFLVLCGGATGGRSRSHSPSGSNVNANQAHQPPAPLARLPTKMVNGTHMLWGDDSFGGCLVA